MAFVAPFACSYIRSFVSYVSSRNSNLRKSVLLNFLEVAMSLQPRNKKAFLFGPEVLETASIFAMGHAPGWGWRSKSRTLFVKMCLFNDSFSEKHKQILVRDMAGAWLKLVTLT